MNKAAITLIHKLKRLKKKSQFQPISLCTVLVKIVTKVLANRMKPLMANFVGEEQEGFIPSRQAPNNILIAQEVMHPMGTKKDQKGWVAVKIALEKHMIV